MVTLLYLPIQCSLLSILPTAWKYKRLTGNQLNMNIEKMYVCERGKFSHFWIQNLLFLSLFLLVLQIFCGYNMPYNREILGGGGMIIQAIPPPKILGIYPPPPRDRHPWRGTKLKRESLSITGGSFQQNGGTRLTGHSISITMGTFSVSGWHNSTTVGNRSFCSFLPRGHTKFRSHGHFSASGWGTRLKGDSISITGGIFSASGTTWLRGHQISTTVGRTFSARGHKTKGH